MRTVIFSALTMLPLSFLISQTLVETLNSEPMNLQIEQAAFACQLTDSEFVERKLSLQKEVFSNVIKVEEVETGYLFHFEDDPTFLPKLFQYMLAEKECCPFFQQDISVKPKGSGITWKLSGAKGIKSIIQQMMDGTQFSDD